MRPWIALPLFAVAVLATAVIGIEMTRSAGNVASVWLPSGLTIGLMVRWPRRRLVIGLISVVMIYLANLSFGDAFLVPFGLTAANVIGFMVIVGGLALVGWKREQIDSSRGILQFAAIAMGVGPLAAALIGASVLNAAYDAPFEEVVKRWFLSDMVGNFLIAPAIISRNAWVRLIRNLREFLLWCVCLLAIGVLVVLTGIESLLFLIPPVMIYLASSMGIGAVGMAGILVALPLAWITVSGGGPIYRGVDGDVGTAIIEVQIFLLVAVGVGQLVAVLMEERRQSEFQLMRYRIAIENAPDGILLADDAGHFVLWNDRVFDLLGTTSDGFGADKAFGRAEYKAENAEIMARLMDGHAIKGMPFRRKGLDGTDVVAELNAVPIMHDGEFAGATISLRDVREELRLKRQAENRARELEAFIDATADGVVGTDADGNVTIWNRAAEEIYGISVDEALRMHIKDIPRAETDAAREARYSRLKLGQRFRNLRTVQKSRDGTEREVEVSINPIFDRDAKFAGIASSVRDMSEIRLAEARTLESQGQLASAMTAITDAIGIFDANERLVHFNEKYAEIIREADEPRRGMTWEHIVRINIDAGTLAAMGSEQDIQDWLAARRESRHLETEPFVISLSNNRWLMGRDYPMENGGFISVRQDVTELKRREEELARSNKDLEQFAFIASHDLREPLRKIQSFGGILVEDYADVLTEEGRTFLGYMTNGADRMEQLIDDLLVFSRAGRSEEPVTQVAMTLMMNEALENLEVLINESGAQITHGVVPDLKVRHLDMVRVLQNLINNSIKYADPDRPCRVVIECAEDSADHVTISIADNGLGIAPENAETIFEPFKRLSRTNRISGTGMGLAIVRKLVDNMGGRIWLETDVTDGACFKIRFAKNGKLHHSAPQQRTMT